MHAGVTDETARLKSCVELLQEAIDVNAEDPEISASDEYEAAKKANAAAMDKLEKEYGVTFG